MIRKKIYRKSIEIDLEQNINFNLFVNPLKQIADEERTK